MDHAKTVAHFVLDDGNVAIGPRRKPGGAISVGRIRAAGDIAVSAPDKAIEVVVECKIKPVVWFEIDAVIHRNARAVAGNELQVCFGAFAISGGFDVIATRLR